MDEVVAAASGQRASDLGPSQRPQLSHPRPLSRTPHTPSQGPHTPYPMPLQEVTSAKQLDELVAAHPEALFVLDFWASWCEPCKQMNDVVAQLSKTHTAVYFIKVPRSRRLSLERQPPPLRLALADRSRGGR